MRKILGAAVAALVLGCGDGTGPTGLALTAESEVLAEGGSTSLSVLLDGKEAGLEGVTLVSRDPSTVAIDGSMARGVAPGITWVVARAGDLTDSVRMVVRFRSMAPNSIATRLAATVNTAEHRFTLSGEARQYERPSGPRFSSIIAYVGDPNSSTTVDPLAGDTVVHIGLSGGLSEGMRSLPPPAVEWTDNIVFRYGGAGVAFVVVESADGSVRDYYVPVGDASLELTSLVAPGEYGTVPGSVSGRIGFEAAGLRVRVPTPPAPLVLEPIGDETIPVYIEFTTDVYRIPLPYSVFDLIGSPYQGEGLSGGGEARLEEGAMVVDWLTLIDREAEQRTLFSSTLQVPTPGVGTFDLSDPAAAAFAGWFAPFIEIPPGSGGGHPGEQTPFTVSSGTVTITEYHAATDDLFGRVVGTVEAVLDFGADRPDHSATLSVSFDVPIRPLGEMIDY